MQGETIPSGAKALPDFSLAAMRQTLRGGLPKTLFKPKPRTGFLPSALGAALFTLVAGGGWLLIENYSAAGADHGTMEAHENGAGARGAMAGR